MFILQTASLKASVLPYGATLSGLWYTGHDPSLVLGSPDKSAYLTELQYFGATIGPLANRISGAHVAVDGELWQLPANEGRNSLHSGPHGLHARDWRILDHGKTHLALACRLAHGELGLPGNRWIEAHYTLPSDKTLRIALTASTDRTTLMNLTHHPYWNLDGSPTVARHSLTVLADSYLPVDADTLPLGDIRDVTDSPYDFRRPRPVAADRLLDANLCLARSRRDDLRDAAVLTTPDGPRLTLRTTAPGLQLYNGFGLERGNARIHDGRALQACAGLALEPQGWPDAPRHAHFPSILLRPGTLYRHVTEYEISE